MFFVLGEMPYGSGSLQRPQYGAIGGKVLSTHMPPQVGFSLKKVFLFCQKVFFLAILVTSVLVATTGLLA